MSYIIFYVATFLTDSFSGLLLYFVSKQSERETKYQVKSKIYNKLASEASKMLVGLNNGNLVCYQFWTVVHSLFKSYKNSLKSWRLRSDKKVASFLSWPDE